MFGCLEDAVVGRGGSTEEAEPPRVVLSTGECGMELRSGAMVSGFCGVLSAILGVSNGMMACLSLSLCKIACREPLFLLSCQGERGVWVCRYR